MAKISDTIYLQIEFQDAVRLLERATKRAIDQALNRFEIDDFGHSNKVKDWSRSDCSIRVDFTGIEMHGGRMGWLYVVKFTAWCEKQEENTP